MYTQASTPLRARSVGIAAAGGTVFEVGPDTVLDESVAEAGDPDEELVTGWFGTLGSPVEDELLVRLGPTPPLEVVVSPFGRPVEEAKGVLLDAPSTAWIPPPTPELGVTVTYTFTVVYIVPPPAAGASCNDVLPRSDGGTSVALGWTYIVVFTVE